MAEARNAIPADQLGQTHVAADVTEQARPLSRSYIELVPLIRRNRSWTDPHVRWLGLAAMVLGALLFAVNVAGHDRSGAAVGAIWFVFGVVVIAVRRRALAARREHEGSPPEDSSNQPPGQHQAS